MEGNGHPYMEQVEVILLAREGDSAAAPVEFPQMRKGRVSDKKRADAWESAGKEEQTGGKPKHFVEGERNEIRLDFREIQPVRGDEGGGVEQNEPC